MIAKKGKFFLGLGMLVAFFVVLFIFFSPIFAGQNGLDYLDSLYNSISKGSAYYIPYAKKQAGEIKGTAVDVSLEMKNERIAADAATLFTHAGAGVQSAGTSLKVSGDLHDILENTLADADHMYANDGAAISSKYQMEERSVMYNWWNALEAMEKALKAQAQFKAAKVVDLVRTKAVETAYNYYKIEPQKIGDKIGLVIFSLIFYVIYTLWYGFAIMYLFEGWGMQLEH